jgi:N-glycosylase/DNA lyase
MSSRGVAPRWSELRVPDFDLEKTLESGQVFHWVRHGDGFRGVIDRTPVLVRQRSDRLRVTAGTQKLVANYFALDESLTKICATFPADPAMRRAVEFCHGLRIIRQPAWECLATFITSSLKQVSHIKQISRTIRERFGDAISNDGESGFSYPSPECLAAQSERTLRDCKLGFRAPNLRAAAKMIAGGKVDLEAIRAFPDDEARSELCRLPGVGPKVANCVLLFAYGRRRAFPIDVWIARVLREVYFKGKRGVTQKRLEHFSQTYFGEHGGYAQQYLFHYARTNRARLTNEN